MVLIGLPIDCEGTPAGTSGAPRVLRELGLRDVVPHAGDRGDLPVSIESRERDPESGVKAAAEVIRVTEKTRSAVARELRSGAKPFLIGGCCTLMMGAMAGARDVLGPVGLAYVDGHLDLYDGRTSPTGDGADMPMAFMLGRAGPLLDDAVGPDGTLAPREVALLGYRDLHLAEPAGSLLPADIGEDFYCRDPGELRARGLASSAQDALAHLQSGPGRYWIHLDWDVLDEAVLPSADYLMPGGLDWDELTALLRPLIWSPQMIGMSLACYNPDNDPELVDGRKIVDALAAMFAQPEPAR